MENSRIQQRSLREMIVDHLQRAIIAGQYGPGHRLVERDLSAEFGVSSIPVREALQELENHGLVVRKHNCGCSVIELTPEEAERVAEFRRVLEPKVVEWAARRATPAQIQDLESQLTRMAQAAEKHDSSGFFHEDLLFHKRLWEMSGNQYATRALESALGALFAAGLRPGGIDLPSEVKKHKRLLDAIRSRDPRLAAKTLNAIADRFEGHIRQRRFSGAPARGVVKKRGRNSSAVCTT